MTAAALTTSKTPFMAKEVPNMPMAITVSIFIWIASNWIASALPSDITLGVRYPPMPPYKPAGTLIVLTLAE